MEVLERDTAWTKEALLARLLESYSAYFDITHMDETACGGLCKALAAYHSFMEKYVLIRKARLWAAHAHEYIFLFTLERLDMAAFERIRDYFMEEGTRLTMEKVDSEHMYTYVTPLILADTVEEEARRALKRFRYYKSFKLSVYGWTTVRLAALEVGTGKLTCNYQGREVGKFVNKIYKERTT